MPIESAISLLLALLDRAGAIGALISAAQARGTDLTDAELDTLIMADDEARRLLVEAIAKARA